MSWYTTMYCGIMKDNKIKPWGPYDANGHLKPIYTESRSFTTEIGNLFYHITEENLTDELKEEFKYECGLDPDIGYGQISPYFGYLPAKDIPSSNYIKRGYCKIKDINEYLNGEYFEGFYDVLDPAEYAMKLENELKFGTPKPKKDEYGEEYCEPSCSEYAYFSWADWNSQEYDAHRMKEMIGVLEDYHMKDDGWEYVIIKTEG